MPMQQMLLGAFAGASKIYIDNVFDVVARTSDGSTYVNSSGLDLSGEGGMVWTKSRSKTDGGAAAFNHIIHDSIRGASYSLSTDNNNQSSTGWAGANTLTSTGYSIAGGDATNNATGYRYADWAFRKSSGFFDLVSYTGNGSARTISHSLGSIPGMIIVKKTSGSEDWTVYHRDIEETKWLYLNTTDGVQGPGANPWNGTRPTASVFSLGTHNLVNENGQTYIAYIFAGGESTAATARSVEFDGNDKLYLSADTDIDVNTGDFTIECFFNVTSVSTHQSFITDWDDMGWQVEINTDGKCQFAWGPNSTAYWSIVGQQKVAAGTWNHIAVVRSGNVFTQYLNGIYDGTFTSSATGKTNGTVNIAYNNDNGASRYVTGSISNVRIVKGTAVYTSSFKPPTAPLTNITNTGLLCCNNSSVTGSTVTPGTISSNGDPTASTDSPFDDPAAFTFGENADQNVIKCGSYVGNGSATGPEINLGFEPQWVLIKNFTSGSGSPWALWDSMRGLVTEGNDAQLYPNQTQAEYTGANRVDLTPTGFKLKQDNHMINSDGSTYIYVCVRMSDGYVGKPPDAGTDVFTIDLAGINAGDPSWVSNFPVDMQFIKDRTGTTYNFFNSTRLTQGTYLSLPGSSAQTSNSVYSHDYVNGWGNYSSSDAEDITSWMWKRNSGFDVVTYTGTGDNSNSGPNTTSQAIPHNLGKIPEMIWVKCRSTGYNWYVYHSGQNGGTNPQNYYLSLNATDGNIESVSPATNAMWNNQAPTSTHFSLGPGNDINANNDTYIAYLFTSVSGISKCGYYDGSSSSQTITTGFQPRFVIIKCTTNAEDWYLLDTLRGWSSGNDNILRPNLTAAQYSNDLGAPTSTGFTLTVDNGSNASGRKYVYYAHA